MNATAFIKHQSKQKQKYQGVPEEPNFILQIVTIFYGIDSHDEQLATSSFLVLPEFFVVT